MSANTPEGMPPPSGDAVLTDAVAAESRKNWAPPTGPEVPLLTASPARRENGTGTSSRAWIFAAVLVGVAVVALVPLVMAGAFFGGVSSGIDGPEVRVYSATRDVSATVLSGYGRDGKPVDQDGAEVLAASVTIENDHDKAQDYQVRLVFTAATGERLAVRNVNRAVPAGRVVTRNVFTRVPRPANADVSVTATAERHDPLTFGPGGFVPGGPGGYLP